MKYKYNGQWYDVTLKAMEGFPIGTGVEFYGETIPTGWLECDGSAVSRTTYSDLFTVIGTTYGAGDGSTTFNLPNLKGRVPVGLDSNDTAFDTLGETGGSKDLQAHNHGGSTGSSTAYNTSDIYTTGGSTNFYAITWGGNKVGNDETYKSKTSHSHTIATDGTGNSGNLQPYLVVKYIIKATQTTPTFASVVNANSNSTTDSYSCDYINDLVKDSYSTSEIKTNKTWGSDNEPIYRKVINFTTGSTLNAQLTVAHGISNFKAVVSLDLYVKAWGNVYRCPDSTINQLYMQGSSNVGYVMVSSGLSDMPAYLIIEYTKNN